MTMDAGEFRQALGRFATGICLVTVEDPELGPLATTVNSFSSVSLDPPLVLWSIQNSSDHFTCAAYAVHPGGDHQIIVGEVLQFESRDAAPLIFFSGCYRALS